MSLCKYENVQLFIYCILIFLRGPWKPDQSADKLIAELWVATACQLRECWLLPSRMTQVWVQMRLMHMIALDIILAPAICSWRFECNGGYVQLLRVENGRCVGALSWEHCLSAMAHDCCVDSDTTNNSNNNIKNKNNTINQQRKQNETKTKKIVIGPMADASVLPKLFTYDRMLSCIRTYSLVSRMMIIVLSLW